MMDYTVPPGDHLALSRDSAVLRFAGRRKVLGTGALNGGMRTGLTAVFNHNDCPRAGAYCRMQGETLQEHQRHTARALSLDPETVTGLNTAANIDNTAIQTMAFADFSVTAIVTGGVEVNGCRVGNPAILHERDGKTEMLAGTVNIILTVDADLSDGCMARALVTCTEAKVAAMQELMVSDRYAGGLATGSGTDGTIVVGNLDSPVKLSEAGGHHKLGEYIGRTVIKAVKESLYRQSGLCPGRQHSVIRRLERFGVTEERLWNAYTAACAQPMAHGLFADMITKMSLDGTIVTLSSLYAHLIDQMNWGLLLPQEAVEAGERILGLLNAHHGMDEVPRCIPGGEPPQLTASMAEAFVRTVVEWVLGSGDTSD